MCNKAFESGLNPDWRFPVIDLLYKGKEKRIKCKNYRYISILERIGKLYGGLLVERICRVTEGLSDEGRGI